MAALQRSLVALRSGAHCSTNCTQCFVGNGVISDPRRRLRLAVFRVATAASAAPARRRNPPVIRRRLHEGDAHRVVLGEGIGVAVCGARNNLACVRVFDGIRLASDRRRSGPRALARELQSLEGERVPATVPGDEGDGLACPRRWALKGLIIPLLAWGSSRVVDPTLLSSAMPTFLVQPEKVEELKPERDYTGTKHIPIFVMLPLGTINHRNELDDPKGLKNDLNALREIGVDGVMVDCWWGLVEGMAPQEYKWPGYQALFSIVRELRLKLQVVMSFHQCGGNVGDDVYIPLPQWVLDVGLENPDIFFTNRNGARNPECLTWGVDEERVLQGRTALEIYYDFMRSFQQEFNEFFSDGTITEVEVGLGPCGELRYPSYAETQGWTYPGIGEFQCYDKFLMKSLKKAAEVRGHLHWAHPPSNSGAYNSKPQDTGFFRDGGDYNSYYGRFFLEWYSESLIEHGDRVLNLANIVFKGTKIAAKVSGIHWWYKTASHATELTCGYYNVSHRDGYKAIADMLAKHNVTLNFTCVELLTSEQTKYFPEAMADPEGLVWQVLNTAWDAGVHVASENALSCYDRPGYNKILENSKPEKDCDGRNLVAFTYLRLNPELMEEDNFLEFKRFVRRLHGTSIADLPVLAPKLKKVLKPTKKLGESVEAVAKL